MKHDPAIEAAAHVALEKLINKALSLDPATRAAVNAQADKSLGIHLEELNLSIAIRFGEPVRIDSADTHCSVMLSGTLPALIRLALNDQAHLANSGVRADGDIALLSELRTIFRQLDIDWEEALCILLGDIGGHATAAILRHQFNWVKGREATLRRLVSEFLIEEWRATPSKTELQQFGDQVDDTMLQADRLAARIDRLSLTFSSAKQGN